MGYLYLSVSSPAYTTPPNRSWKAPEQSSSHVELQQRQSSGGQAWAPHTSHN